MIQALPDIRGLRELYGDHPTHLLALHLVHGLIPRLSGHAHRLLALNNTICVVSLTLIFFLLREQCVAAVVAVMIPVYESSSRILGRSLDLSRVYYCWVSSIY